MHNYVLAMLMYITISVWHVLTQAIHTVTIPALCMYHGDHIEENQEVINANSWNIFVSACQLLSHYIMQMC